MLNFSKTSVFKFLSPITYIKSCMFTLSYKQSNDTFMFYNPKTEPLISNVCHHNVSNKFYLKPRQIWVENLDTIPEQKLGLTSLNPNVFGMQPRVDIIHENIRWQKLFRFVSYANTKVRSEVRGGGCKPWPQKGLGKARHGSIRSPLWRKGGVAHGPRSPTPHFYMLPFYVRVIGLASTFSIKLAQDDLHLVSELEFPNNESFYIKELIKKRNWGPSVLFIDNNDIVSQNVALATASLKDINIIPVYGLNVYSLLKHDTIVVTERAVKIIENKLLHHLHRIDSKKVSKPFKM